MTKSPIVSHFSEKFEISKKSSAAILDEVAALAVTETKKTGSIFLNARIDAEDRARELLNSRCGYFTEDEFKKFLYLS